MTYVSAILRFADKEAGFDRVRDLLMQAAKGEIELLLGAVNWGEIAGALYKRAGELKTAITKAGKLGSNLAALPVTIVTADKTVPPLSGESDTSRFRSR
jgi:hypothetical protein